MSDPKKPIIGLFADLVRLVRSRIPDAAEEEVAFAAAQQFAFDVFHKDCMEAAAVHLSTLIRLVRAEIKHTEELRAVAKEVAS